MGTDDSPAHSRDSSSSGSPNELPPGGRTTPPHWGRPPQDLLARSTDGTHTLLKRCRKAEAFGAVRPHLGEIPLIARLGRGGMAAVFLGWHEKRGEQVALKVLPDVQHLERFRREARIATELHSPHLAHVYDVDRDAASGLNYLVMEYVSGQAASDWAEATRASERITPERTTLEIILAATHGMAVAHASNVVHRDLKPDNILIPADASGALLFSRAKVIDLGLARSLENDTRLTATGVPMGTPGYMPAEQCLNAFHAAATADVFALGASIYDMLAGQPPFPRDLAGTLTRTPTGVYTSLAERRPDVSRGTVGIVTKCLAREPHERFQSAGELTQALENALRDLPPPRADPGAAALASARLATASLLSPSAGAGGRPGAKRRQPIVSAYVVLAAVVSLLLVGLILLFAGRRDAARLTVESDASGTAVFIDGESVGVTPLVDFEIPSGDRVRVSIDAPDGPSKWLRLRPGESRKLRITQQPR